MLSVRDLHSYYGKSHIVQGVSLDIGAGEIVSLLGRNGAGKTTTLKSLVGLVSGSEGRVELDGRRIDGNRTCAIARQGVVLVPEHRGIFAELTVEENLAIAERRGSGRTRSAVYDLFPRLAERRCNRGDAISGGEQQMLAIGRAVLCSPKVLLLDEPTEGLAPVIVDELIRIVRGLAQEGIAVLVVEQNIRFCEAVASRHYILSQGKIVFEGTSDEFGRAGDARETYLALGSPGKSAGDAQTIRQGINQ